MVGVIVAPHVFAQVTPGQPSCAFYCHGREGRVGKGPKLRGQKLEPGYVYQRTANGFPPMPAYQRILSEGQLWDLVAYVLSLADTKDD